MRNAVKGSITRLAGATALVLLGLLAANASPVVAGPFAGENGKLATVRDAPDSGAFLGSISPAGKFDPIYEEWDYNLAGAKPSFSPDGSRIALNVSWRPTQLAISKTTKSRLKYVDTHRIQAYDPTWTADGRIVFSGQTLKGKRVGTYSIRPDGSDLRKHFGRATLAASNSGEFVGAGKHYIELRNRKGERVRVLARSKKHNFVDPEFSPDGRHIVYQRYLDPGRIEHAGDRLGDILVVGRDGTDRRRLTSAKRDMYPTFSPDGRWVAFIRHNPKGLTSNVFAIRSDGSGKARRITNDRQVYYSQLSWGRG